MDALVVASSGALGQVVGTFFVFPLDVVKTRLQASEGGGAAASLPQALARLLREEGALSILRMFPSKAISLFISRFTYFFLYQSVKNRYRALTGARTISFGAGLFLGYIAGVLNTLFITPLERITTKVMAAPPDEPVSMRAAAEAILVQQGAAGLYFGWQSTFYNSLCPAVQNAVFDRLRTLVLLRRASTALSWAESFALGAVAKAASTYSTYPIIRSKTLIYNMNAEPSQAAPSIVAMIAKTHKAGGVAGLYQGLTPTLLKGVMQSAVMLAVKERVDVAVRVLFGMDARR